LGFAFLLVSDSEFIKALIIVRTSFGVSFPHVFGGNPVISDLWMPDYYLRA
jgi:hypothetical protein